MILLSVSIRRQLYLGLFDNCIDKEKRQLIRKSTESDTIIGCDVFKEKIEAVLQRCVIKKGHGGGGKSKGFKSSDTLTALTG